MRYAVLTAKHHEGFCLRDSRLTGFTAAHAPAGPGDVATPERYQPARPLLSGGVPVPWEACQTRNGSWGYDRDNRNAKSAGLLLRMLIDGVSKNGNMLLNVGPTGRGEFAPAALAVLEESGAWMRLHERSVRGAGPAPFTPPPDVRCTRRGATASTPTCSPGRSGTSTCPAWRAGSPTRSCCTTPRKSPATGPARRPHPPRPPRAASPLRTLTLTLPAVRPDAVPVIELFLTGEAAQELPDEP
ncbi:alpha-L-fucosidase [Streptomyces sp. 7-21]|uniref:alpha-L-fucosidase n=1 Tax=Streptomyces sp. 7-21 TaxID=2802283 RepID=UPI001F35D0E9|nr:alpha-L-fucosidase [Streptomyces sp. 7-21]